MEQVVRGRHQFVHDFALRHAALHGDRVEDERHVEADDLDAGPLEVVLRAGVVVVLVAENPRLKVVPVGVPFHVTRPRVPLRLVDGDLHLPDEFALPPGLGDEVAGHVLVQLAYLLDGELLQLPSVRTREVNAVVVGLRHHVPET